MVQMSEKCEWETRMRVAPDRSALKFALKPWASRVLPRWAKLMNTSTPFSLPGSWNRTWFVSGHTGKALNGETPTCPFGTTPIYPAYQTFRAD